MKEISFSLGWELEASKAAGNIPDGIKCGTDGSVSGDGVEYRISKRLIHDIPQSLKKLEELCSDGRIDSDDSCGFHVHIGIGQKNKRAQLWAGWFVTLARSVEAFAFNAVPDSRQSSRYCQKWNNPDAPKSVIEKSYETEKQSNRDRYYWVNVVEMFRPGGIKTVEVRLLGETARYDYCLAWIGACFLMARHAWTLIDDPSMLASASQELRQTFKRIEKYIKTNSRYSQSEAQSIANQARLIPIVEETDGNNIEEKIEAINRMLSVISEKYGLEDDASKRLLLEREYDHYSLIRKRLLSEKVKRETPVTTF